MDKNLLIFKYKPNSNIIVAFNTRGSTVGAIMYLSEGKDFGFSFVYEFYPFSETGFSVSGMAASNYIQDRWILFNLNDSL